MPHLADLDRVTGEVLRGPAGTPTGRYEHARPGAMLHVDVKKLGKVPPGGGWRAARPQRGRSAAAATAGTTSTSRSMTTAAWPTPRSCPTRRARTCAGFLHRAASWFRDQHGVTVRRVLTDNAKSYRISPDWIAVCSALQIKRRFIKPALPLDQRQGRAVQPDPADRWAYRPSLDLATTTAPQRLTTSSSSTTLSAATARSQAPPRISRLAA